MIDQKSNFLIVAGVNKAGTTSLFSYLNQHPDLCGSSIKETCFFLPIRYNETIEPIEKYYQLFTQCKNPAYFMESTPGYFYGGQKLIDSIKQNLGDRVKIVLVFRDPVQRLLSFFKFQKSRLNLEAHITLDEYIKTCHALEKSHIQAQANNHLFGLEGGKYAHYIEPWLKSFNKDIKIIFFEHLKENPKVVLAELSNWLGIDAKPFEHITIEVENKTRNFNNRFMQKAALTINHSFEKFFRNNPNFKKKLRNLYFSFNEKSSSEKFDASILNELNEFYKPYNQNLKQILTANKIENLPDWAM